VRALEEVPLASGRVQNGVVRVVLAALIPLAVAGAVSVVAAPTAGAGCNDSSGTVVCAQGDIRGTHAPPPGRGTFGPIYGSWCNDQFCFAGSGPGLSIGP
jgi:hypothetical protein